MYVNVMDFQVYSLQIDEHFIWSLCRLQSQHSACSLRKKCVNIHTFLHLLSSLLDLQSKVFHQINLTSHFTKKVHTTITSISWFHEQKLRIRLLRVLIRTTFYVGDVSDVSCNVFFARVI